MSAHHVELARRLRAGDQAALAEIAAEFSPRVSAWLARKHGDRLPHAEIEGVMQETLLTLWLKRESIESERDVLRALFAAIASNIALRHLGNDLAKGHRREDLPATEDLDLLAWDRREIRRPQSVEDADGGAHGQCDRSPRDRFRQRHLPIMSEMLAVLTEGERAALLAVNSDGSSIAHAEAAAQLGVNQSTFRSRLKRAREKVDRECASRGLPAPNWRAWGGNIDDSLT